MKSIKASVSIAAFVVVAVFGSVGEASASDYLPPAPSHICTKYQEMGEYIMTKRQYRRSETEVLNEFARYPGNTLYNIIKEAYATPSYHNASAKRMAAENFGYEIFLRCRNGMLTK